MKNNYSKQYCDSFDEIDDLKNPTIWICRLMTFINDLYNKELNDNAFKTMKDMFMRTYPYVARHLTSKEQERVKSLLQFGLLF